MERKLASVQSISAIQAIPGADSIELATVLGWYVIIKKGEFAVGDSGVFFEIDSILPEQPWSEFLRNKDFRVRTMKLTKFGVISQGLMLPLSILPYQESVTDGEKQLLPLLSYYKDNVGMGVTDLLGVIKWEPKEDGAGANMSSKVTRPFISGVPKTDEERVQSVPWVLDVMKGRPWYSTVKVDGSSGTFIYTDDGLRVASRNLEVSDDGNIWWEAAHKYEMDKNLAKYPFLAFQGEVYGDGIQKNRLGLKRGERQLAIFNVYSVKIGEYLSLNEMQTICAELGLPMVEIEKVGGDFNFTVDQLSEECVGTYPNGFPREGLVYRPQQPKLHPILGQVSFKVINPHFLLKIGE